MFEIYSIKMQKIERWGTEKESILRFLILAKEQIQKIKALKEITNKLIVNKLNKDLNDACKKNEIHYNRAITYHEMVKIMYSMGYILDNITEYEKLLIDNIFQSIWNKDKATAFLK